MGEWFLNYPGAYASQIMKETENPSFHLLFWFLQRTSGSFSEPLYGYFVRVETFQNPEAALFNQNLGYRLVPRTIIEKLFPRPMKVSDIIVLSVHR